MGPSCGLAPNGDARLAGCSTIAAGSWLLASLVNRLLPYARAAVLPYCRAAGLSQVEVLEHRWGEDVGPLGGPFDLVLACGGLQHCATCHAGSFIQEPTTGRQGTWAAGAGRSCAHAALASCALQCCRRSVVAVPAFPMQFPMFAQWHVCCYVLISSLGGYEGVHPCQRRVQCWTPEQAGGHETWTLGLGAENTLPLSGGKIHATQCTRVHVLPCPQPLLGTIMHALC